MKLIELNKGYSVKVDDADFDELSKTRWYANVSNRGYVYAVGQVSGKRHSMHRLLCGQPGLVVDHINGDTLDNRRENLRSVTAAINAGNLHCAARSNTGAKGVHQRKRDGKFIATSSANGPRKHIGSFATLEAATAAVGEYEAASPSETIPALLRRIAELESRLANQARSIP